jgi:selenocysteine lyase/cysteine desulfurase
VFDALYRDHGIAGAAMGGTFAGVRLCPHIYNTMEEVERVATIVARMA